MPDEAKESLATFSYKYVSEMKNIIIVYILIKFINSSDIAKQVAQVVTVDDLQTTHLLHVALQTILQYMHKINYHYQTKN